MLSTPKWERGREKEKEREKKTCYHHLLINLPLINFHELLSKKKFFFPPIIIFPVLFCFFIPVFSFRFLFNYSGKKTKQKKKKTFTTFSLYLSFSSSLSFFFFYFLDCENFQQLLLQYFCIYQKIFSVFFFQLKILWNIWK